jgi:ParB-like nuclease domain
MHQNTLPVASQIEQWPLDSLIPYARNPRTHSDAQIAQIAASIAEFGFTNPILVDSKNGVIAGHGRLLGARKLGLATVPVIVLDHLSETQKRAYIVADNKLALNAGWDDELLALELVELKDADYDLNVLGFDPKELDDLLTGVDDEKADEVPPLPEHAVSRPGDLWLCGDTRIQHRVLCGDCADPKTVERLLADRKTVSDGHRPAVWNRIGFGVARPRGFEWLRPGRIELYEEAHERPHQHRHLLRYPC